MLRQYFSHANGEGGTPFSTTRGGNHVKKVVIWSWEICPQDGDALIVAVKLVFADRTSVRHGGNVSRGNHVDIFDVPEGDQITQAIVHCDWGTHGIQFVTKNGIRSKLYGGNGPHQLIWKAASMEELCGMSGRAGFFMDKITFHFRMPVRVETVYCYLVPHIEIAKGIGFRQSKTIKTRWGMTTSNTEYNQNSIRFIAAEAMANIASALMEDERGYNTTTTTTNGSTIAAFYSALSSTHVECEIEESFEIDTTSIDRGVYIYTGCARIVMSNGDEIIMNGKSFCIHNEPITISKVFSF
jgi:hypothetical protein